MNEHRTRFDFIDIFYEMTNVEKVMFVCTLTIGAGTSLSWLKAVLSPADSIYSNRVHCTGPITVVSLSTAGTIYNSAAKRYLTSDTDK